jgi:intracellular multiplication protein IcmB
MPTGYRRYHKQRIAEIREDPKRIVYDEFHRTSKAQAVRDQVVVDMREGRKWKVQVALLSQSLDDFDSVMVEFATSVFIMDAGPEQTIRKTQEMFGFSDTAANALRTRVNGPGPAGATFLAQFATKDGPNTQLLTSTLGPVELWALSTTAEDVQLRKALYERLGPRNARRLLAGVFPSGTATKLLEDRYSKYESSSDSLMDDDSKEGVIKELIDELVQRFHKKEF